MQFDLLSLDWEKTQQLIPVVVQDSRKGQVLMLGYMNQEALEKTLSAGKVTFWSRSRNQLWTKGETSGNFLIPEEILSDCDGDTLLIKAKPLGPTCHRGTDSCFGSGKELSRQAFLIHLEEIVRRRFEELPDDSYTSTLFQQGLMEISKKVGEEAVEVVVSAQQQPRRTIEEIADLLYHLVVFLVARGLSLNDVMEELYGRHCRSQGRRAPSSESISG